MIINNDIIEWCKDGRWNNEPKFHAVLCDPPYELGFMGKSWDSTGIAFDPKTWKAIGDQLYPGAYLLAFGGTRTFHRIAVAIEDAGFEIRDTVMWVYGSGFPKSHDVSKAIAKQKGIGLCTCAVSEPCYNGGYEKDIQREDSGNAGDDDGQGTRGESGSKRTTSDAMETARGSSDISERLSVSTDNTLLKLPKENNSQEQGVLAVKESILQSSVREPVYEETGLGDASVRTGMETGTSRSESDAPSVPGLPNTKERGATGSPSSSVQVRGQKHDGESSGTLPVLPQQGRARNRKDTRENKDTHRASQSNTSSQYLCAKCGKVRKGLGGTALKPSWEPIIIARKPLEGTVAQNALKYGSGALNIDGCRVEGIPPSVPQPNFNSPTGKIYNMKTGEGRNGEMSYATGRWPANLILSWDEDSYILKQGATQEQVNELCSWLDANP